MNSDGKISGTSTWSTYVLGDTAQSAQVQVTVTDVGGFTNTVTLTVQIDPPGPGNGTPPPHNHFRAALASEPR